jgi:hypothetical protein
MIDLAERRAAHVPILRRCPDIVPDSPPDTRRLLCPHDGGALLRHARTLARNAGVTLLRVDCYAGHDGDDGKLASWYESQGFRPVSRFTVDGDRGPWPGLLLEDRIG